MKLPFTVHCAQFMAFLCAVWLITLRFVTHNYILALETLKRIRLKDIWHRIRDNAGDIETMLWDGWMGNLGSISLEARGVSFLQNIQPGFESMQLSIKTIPGAVFPRVKRSRREGNHSPPFLPRFGMSELHFSLWYNSTACTQETSAVPLKGTPYMRKWKLTA